MILDFNAKSQVVGIEIHIDGESGPSRRTARHHTRRAAGGSGLAGGIMDGDHSEAVVLSGAPQPAVPAGE